MNDMTEQRHERMPRWLQWLVAYTIAQSIAVIVLLLAWLIFPVTRLG